MLPSNGRLSYHGRKHLESGSLLASQDYWGLPLFSFAPIFREKYGYQQGAFLNAEWIFDPMHPLPLTAKLTPGDAEYVVEPIQLILTQQGW